MLENKFAQFIVIFSITQTHIQSSIQIKMRQIILLVEQIIITDDDNDDLCVPLSFATETGKDIIFICLYILLSLDYSCCLIEHLVPALQGT